MEAYPEKMQANPDEMKSIAAREEVPKEKASVGTVRALKKRYGDRHLAIGRRRQLKKRAQGDGGTRKKMATSADG
jgi:hypothetical protein